LLKQISDPKIPILRPTDKIEFSSIDLLKTEPSFFVLESKKLKFLSSNHSFIIEICFNFLRKTCHIQQKDIMKILKNESIAKGVFMNFRENPVIQEN